MEIKSPEILLLTIIFLLPGYIYFSVLKIILPESREGKFLLLLKFLGFSSFNFIIWFWLIVRIDFQDISFLTILGILLIIFISPIFFGIVSGKEKQYGLFANFLKFFGLNPKDISPTAWDFKFSNTTTEFVLVTLKDGEIIGGYLGENSLASSDFNERDIFLEEVYKISDGGEWIVDDRSKGIWIAGDQIRTIEFLKGG